MSSSLKKKKRSRKLSSVFDAVDEFNSQDTTAARKRKTSSTNQVKQSKAARSQTKIHGHLMECRILLQRAMVAVGNDETKDDSADAIVDSCNQLLAKLLKAKGQLQDGASTTTTNYEQLVESEALSDLLQEEYMGCRQEWKKVLDKRHDELRLHAGLAANRAAQFRVMDSSFWQQVEATVSHEQLRLTSLQNDQDQPIFDDSKVYQHMLQDFLLASGNNNNNNSSSQEDAAAQRLRRAIATTNKKTKEVDRRATKGRKIRFVEIPKLVNFTFPVARPALTTGMDEDEWFRSLFSANRK